MLNQVFGLVLSVSVINSGAVINQQDQKINIHSSSYESALDSDVYSLYASNSFYEEVSKDTYTSVLKKRELEKKRREEAKRKAEVEKQKQLALANKKTVSASTPIKSTTPTKVSGDFESVIRTQCARYGCNPSQLTRVMYCESGGRSNAYNPSGASGLFQFMPRTFYANAARVGINNPNIWNPYHQIQTAAWMFANGQSYQWVCK